MSPTSRQTERAMMKDKSVIMPHFYRRSSLPGNGAEPYSDGTNLRVQQEPTMEEALKQLSIFYNPRTKCLERGDAARSTVVSTTVVEKDLDEESDDLETEEKDSGLCEVSPRSTLDTRLSLPEVSSFSSLSSLDYTSEDSKPLGRRGSDRRRSSHQGRTSRDIHFPVLQPLLNFFSWTSLKARRSSSGKDSEQLPEEFLKEESDIGGNAVPASPTLDSDASCAVASSAGAGSLIFESRPWNLPAKEPKEAAKHAHLYTQMIAAARKKATFEARKREKAQKQQLKDEEEQSASAALWSEKILPNWESMCREKKTLELWGRGLPSNVRGRVWSKAIGNELQIKRVTYDYCMERVDMAMSSAKEEEIEAFEQIELDISRTFPQLAIFQKGGPYHESLHRMLSAYTFLSPDVGYVQGMAFLGAFLLLQMEPPEAFIAFSNLLRIPLLQSLFSMHPPDMMPYFKAFETALSSYLPLLAAHFQSLSLSPELYLLDWLMSLYTKPLPLELTCRVWDLFLRDGESTLYRVALGILKRNQSQLLELDFIQAAQLLTTLPVESIPPFEDLLPVVPMTLPLSHLSPSPSSHHSTSLISTPLSGLTASLKNKVKTGGGLFRGSSTNSSVTKTSNAPSSC